MTPEPLRVLMIEDEPNTAKLFKSILNKSPYTFHVDHALNADSGLRILSANAYDIITLDYELPDTNGLEALAKIRKMKLDTPVVMVTGAGDEMLAAKAIRAGAQDYIIKSPQYVKTLPRVLQRAIHDHRLNKQLEQSKKRYWDLFQNANVGIFVLDAKTYQLQQVNRHAAQLLDIPFPVPKSHLRRFADYAPPHEHEKLDVFLKNVSKLGKATLEKVYLYRPDRSAIVIDMSGSLVKSGAMMHIELFVRDITEKLEMQHKVQLGAQRLNSVFNGITDPICVIDRNFKLKMGNRKYQHLTGLGGARFTQATCYQALFKREFHCENCQARTTFSTGKTKFIEINSDDKVYHIWTFPMNNLKDKPDYIVEYIKDVTDQKEIERQLIKSEKLAAIGLLSSGIAHELRNPLNIIETARYNIELILNHKNEEVDKKLAVIKTSIDRASTIINNLLQFSKHSDFSKEAIDIEHLLQSTISLLEKEMLSANVKCEYQFKNVPRVNFNLDSLKQVFLNIILNAVQAMPNGGDLKVTTHTSMDGRWVLVDFRDTGMGISEENQKNIFTPFFTTKSADGTGLGLYLSYTLMKREGGDIFVRSQEGFGSIFTLKIPAYQEPIGGGSIF